MQQRWHNPWIESEDADPFVALLAMLIIGAVAAGIALANVVSRLVKETGKATGWASGQQY